MTALNQVSVFQARTGILQHRCRGRKTVMRSRFKTNNFIALLIACILFAAGFALYFLHQQSKPDEQVGQIKAPESVIAENELTAAKEIFSAAHTKRT